MRCFQGLPAFYATWGYGIPPQETEHRIAKLLQRRLPASVLLGELDLGHRDQHLGAGLEIRRLEQCLFLGHAVGRHHGERVDQRLVRGILDALPVGLEIVGLEKILERLQQALAVDRVLALARREVVAES